jgi:hypothetical protein
LFDPTQDDPDATIGYDLSFADTSGWTFSDKKDDDNDNDNDDDDEYDGQLRVPILNITPA